MQLTRKFFDRFGRAILILLALGALGAFWDGAKRVATASEQEVWVQTWRMLGYIVFSSLFLLLALRPRSLPGIWEVVTFHKFGMVVASTLLPRTPETNLASNVDIALVALLALAYISTQGWQSWRHFRATQHA